MVSYHPFGYCKRHGVFLATAFTCVEGRGPLSIKGIATNCATCNGTSEVIPGRYEVTPKGLNLQIDPSISSEALAALKDIAEREISPEAKQEAEAIGPETGELFDIAKWPAQAKATLYSSIVNAIGAVTTGTITAAGAIGAVYVAIKHKAKVNKERRKQLKERRSALNPKPPPKHPKKPR